MNSHDAFICDRCLPQPPGCLWECLNRDKCNICDGGKCLGYVLDEERIREFEEFKKWTEENIPFFRKK